MSTPAPPVPRPGRRGGPITLLTWVVLGLVPVLWVVELTGPEWLNLTLRALWVVLAVGTVAGGLWVLVLRPRRTREPGDRRR